MSEQVHGCHTFEKVSHRIQAFHTRQLRDHIIVFASMFIQQVHTHHPGKNCPWDRDKLTQCVQQGKGRTEFIQELGDNLTHDTTFNDALELPYPDKAWDILNKIVQDTAYDHFQKPAKGRECKAQKSN